MATGEHISYRWRTGSREAPVTWSDAQRAAPGPQPSPGQAPAVRGSAVWLPPGASTVTVGGYEITGGLIYLGSGAPAAYTATYEPALIDPTLPVRRVRLDDETPGDAPSYADMSAGARAAYLEWLAGGRAGPTAPAHLWLFLYGLERRVLVDLAGTLGRIGEYAAIGAELAALRAHYDLPDFNRRAGALAELVAALAGLGDPELRPPGPPPGGPGDELPVTLRVGLGRYVAGRQPISAAWAYAWYTHHPWRRRDFDAPPEESLASFSARYLAAHPGGRVIPMPAEELVLTYEPASPGFAGRTVRVHTQLPDVRGLPAPLDEPDLAPAEPDGLDLDAMEAAVRRARSQAGNGARWTPAAPAFAAPVFEAEPEPPAEAQEPPKPMHPDRPQLAAAEALLRLVSIAGLSDEQVRAVRRYAVDALGLGVTDRHRLDDGLDEFAHRRPAAEVIRQRYARLPRTDQDAVANLLIATAGAAGSLEPALFAMLVAVFTLLGPGRVDLDRRLTDLEVASVSFDGGPDDHLSTTVLDHEAVEQTLAGAAASAGIVERLTAPAPRTPAAPLWYATTG
jgi:hypothetical protein